MGEHIERLSGKVKLTRYFVPTYPNPRYRPGGDQFVDAHWVETDDINSLPPEERAAIQSRMQRDPYEQTVQDALNTAEKRRSEGKPFMTPSERSNAPFNRPAVSKLEAKVSGDLEPGGEVTIRVPGMEHLSEQATVLRTLPNGKVEVQAASDPPGATRMVDARNLLPGGLIENIPEPSAVANLEARVSPFENNPDLAYPDRPDLQAAYEKFNLGERELTELYDLRDNTPLDVSELEAVNNEIEFVENEES